MAGTERFAAPTGRDRQAATLLGLAVPTDPATHLAAPSAKVDRLTEGNP